MGFQWLLEEWQGTFVLDMAILWRILELFLCWFLSVLSVNFTKYLLGLFWAFFPLTYLEGDLCEDITLSMQKKAKRATAFFSVCLFIFMCMVLEEFKTFPRAREAFCCFKLEQLLGISEGSVIDTSWSISQCCKICQQSLAILRYKLYLQIFQMSDIYFSFQPAHFFATDWDYRSTWTWLYCSCEMMLTWISATASVFHC